MIKHLLRHDMNLKVWGRKLSASTFLRKGVVGKEFTSTEALLAFLRTPTGSVREVIPQFNSSTVVDERVVRKMLHLSGLETDVSPATIQKWIGALNTQIGFIDHLRDLDTETSQSEPVEKASEVFRLIESDHVPHKGLTLAELQDMIAEFNKEAKVVNGEEKFDAKKYMRCTIENVTAVSTKE